MPGRIGKPGNASYKGYLVCRAGCARRAHRPAAGNALQLIEWGGQL